ncbi:cell wall hydrolase [Sphingomonas sp. AX6]|uniref:cell wall hydrolase n=1 Tax=Sphingomonas sp. AX6 TaxID=2653171 RepID=UPI00135A0103|nr:cell wall hydrolase [Sphingomonas sp. AX6]
MLTAPADQPGVAAARPVRPAMPATAAPPLIGFLDHIASDRRPPALVAAQTRNAAIPFARVPTRSAPPFFISGEVADRTRAADCLAAAGYYEAGNDTRGQRAVMQVVLNRMRNPAYPRSVCGVVFQGSERSTGCQFTFTCDGAMTRHRPSASAWEAARRTAIEALNGVTDATVGHATHYHTDWVHPYWSRTLDKIAAVDSHLFFQASALRPGNFTGSYAGVEPSIARLGWLSGIHRDTASSGAIAAMPADAPDAVALAATALEVAMVASPPPERLPDRSDAPADGVFLVALDAGADPDSFLQLAIQRCQGFAQCKLIGWTDARHRPSRFPMPGSAIDAISFSYNRTGVGAAEEVRWSCAEFRRTKPVECLRRG